MKSTATKGVLIQKNRFIGADLKEKLKGIAYVLLSVFVFSVSNMLVKDVGNSYPIIEVLFIRFAVALPLTVLFFIKVDLPGQTWGKSIKSGNLKLEILCGVLISIGLGCLFLSFKYLPLADAQTISFSSSLFVTALAYPILKEKVGLHRWTSVVIGFIGVIIVIQPTLDFINKGAVLGLIFSLLQALVLLYARVLMKTDSPILVSLYTTVTGLALTLPFLPFVWVTPSFWDLVLLLVLGLGGGLGQIFIVMGYKHVEASLASPFLYSALIWGILFDLLIWAHLPNQHMLIGAGLIIVSSLYILMREKHLDAVKNK